MFLYQLFCHGALNLTLSTLLTTFLYARFKNGMYDGNTCCGQAGGWCPQGFGFKSQRVFIRYLSNLVNMLVCIMSRPSSITSQISAGTPELWPFNCLKLRFLLSESKSFCPVFIKLGEYVGGHNISTMFYNQPNPLMHSWIMALELSKIRVSAL